MMSPLVSVIMPAYNAGKFISESIESVLQQTYTNWELIIVDDGSIDNTKDIAQEYVAKDNRIKYFWQENGRQGKARNLALSHARGELIAFLDADDIWLPNKLDIQLDVIQRKNVDLVFADSYLFTTLPIHTNLEKLQSGVGPYSGQESIESFLTINKIPILTVLVKKDAIKAVNGFIEDISVQNAEDYHLWLKLLIKGFSFYGLPRPLAAYRRHEASMTINPLKLSVSVIEALIDISNTHPQYKKTITKKIRRWIKVSLEYTREFEQKKFINICKRGFQFIGYDYYFKLIIIVNKFLNRRAAIRLSYFILNYL